MSRTGVESLDKLSPDPSTVVQESHTSVDPEVINALYSIRTTPYANSFLSRIQGTSTYIPPGLLAVDWETRAPWMDLLRDIPDHFAFAQYVRRISSLARQLIYYKPRTGALEGRWRTYHILYTPSEPLNTSPRSPRTMFLGWYRW